MTKLEQAARALCIKRYGHLRGYKGREALYRDEARAVIEAIREPSEGMVDAGYDLLNERGCQPLTGDTDDVWQAMIDTLLSEQTP